MGLAFLNPAFLWGLSFTSIPIIIHLLYRRRFKILRWGAMEFLRLSEKKQQQRLRLEQLLLLLLRCLILALVALAISRPVMNAAGIPLLGARGPVHAIIVLDNSYSMAFQPEGAGGDTLFDRAKERALDLLKRGLREGDAVSLVMASDPPEMLVGKPTRDLDGAASTLVAAGRLSQTATDYGKVAEVCLQLFGESSLVNREVYFLTDNQKLAWEGPSGEPRLDLWRSLSQTARINILNMTAVSRPNQAVTELRLVGGLVTTRTAARIQATVVNHSNQSISQALVTLEVDGAGAESLRVDLPPRGEATISFRHLFERSGIHPVAVRLAGDRLPLDDARYLVARARDSLQVLILNGKPDPLPQRDGAFFLRHALAPPIARPGDEPSPLEVRVRAGSTFGGMALEDYDVVVLADVAALGAEDRASLAQFIQDGGGVLVFLGGQVNASLYNRDLFESTPSIMPAKVLGARDAPEEKLFLDPNSLSHPALSRFEGAEDVDLNTAEFKRYVALAEPEEGTDTLVMARFTNGDPALVEKRFGAGSLIVFASTANVEWNELPFKPVFLPLMQELVAYLAGGADRNRDQRIGEPLVKSLPLGRAAQAVAVRSPGGETIDIDPVVDDRGATVTVAAPRESGYYEFDVPGEPADQLSVNLDPAESDLSHLNERALKTLLPEVRFTWIQPQEELLTAITRARLGVELWRPLLLLALVLMLVETALAQKFGRRR